MDIKENRFQLIREIKENPAVKIHCDATIAFPLLVMGAFVEKKARQKLIMI
ncbi:MAG TPA: hypothetical protein VJH68_02770 [Candidatus Nanoarchaeia archaeon]|nr:hypothetical protein [Candidatus Nanoarchaeia archaeon]